MPTPALAPGWLAGRIVDRDGRALPGACVTAWTHSSDGRTALRANGDDDGRFRLGPLPANVGQMIWCEAPGFARLRLGDEQAPEIAVFPDATNELGDVVLAEEIVAAGTVLDPDGHPVVGAAVTLTPYYHQLAHTVTANGEPLETRTADDGTFRFGSLAPCSAHVEVAVPGFPRLHTGARITSTDRTIDFGLLRFDRASTVVAGIVTDRRGRPLAGAHVTANEDGDVHAVTDEHGRFELTARAARVDYVWVTHPASTMRASVLVRDPANVRLSFELPRVLEGLARDAETGQPVTIAELNVCEVRRRESDGTITLAG